MLPGPVRAAGHQHCCCLPSLASLACELQWLGSSASRGWLLLVAWAHVVRHVQMAGGYLCKVAAQHAKELQSAERHVSCPVLSASAPNSFAVPCSLLAGSHCRAAHRAGARREQQPCLPAAAAAQRAAAPRQPAQPRTATSSAAAGAGVQVG
jgi:hypothetical protein